jgi:hypothetical protein
MPLARSSKRSTRTLIQQSRAVSPQQKAIYHAVVGAGKSRVKRDFFALGPGDAEAITRLLQGRITTRMQRGTT